MVAAADKETQAVAGRVFARADVAGRVGDLRTLLRVCLEREWTERRFFLWLPVTAGAGVVLYFQADREPSLSYAASITLVLVAASVAVRGNRRALVVISALAAVASGFTAAAVRTASIAHPLLDHVRILKLAGTIEEVDLRRTGARFVLHLRTAGDPALDGRLTRVRLTTRRSDPLQAGDTVALTARLVPPASAALPGGYDFARDAYFAGLDAVGSVLGRVRPDPQPEGSGMVANMRMSIDRARNALAARVSTVLDGDIGAIAAAMVTGKRDLLSDDGRELIREAGIFHIITIAGVQMTLVAGLLFGGLRAIFAAVPALALRYPIKIWAAAGAMAGAVVYDLMTGSRIGTQRALVMTLFMLGAVLCERRAFTMRNLALAALAVIAIEPETILGASFELSFAAVAALVAVQEARSSRSASSAQAMNRPDLRARADWLVATMSRGAAMVRGAGRLLFATVAATSATAPVMAGNFHEISPYVVVGNPLTLGIIEFFAVPGALLGSVLYPLGLDRFVWHWVGWGIALVLWAARLIAGAPGATLTVPAFAPWALACFALATCSAVIWRSVPLRLTALPFLAAGLTGAFAGPRYDLIVAPNGDAAAFRTETGQLALAGRVNTFSAAQWLKADGDARSPDAVAASGTPGLRCDPSACVGRMSGGKTLSLVAKPDAFEEDCRRVDIIVTPLFAPSSCAAEVIVDRGSLAGAGAMAFTTRSDALLGVPARATGEDRPWSAAPSSRLAQPLLGGNATADPKDADAGSDVIRSSDSAPDPVDP